MPTSVPRTIDAWLKLLGPVRLPVEEGQHLRLRQLMGDTRRSWRDIAERVELCPSYALSVMRAANKEAMEPAQSIEAALMRIGMQRCEQLLASLPAQPLAKIPSALLDVQLMSVHASQQARGLFGASLARLRNELSTGGLLFLTPIWALVNQFPDFFETWRERVLIHGESASLVESELLGVSLLSLCRRLVEYWRLPEWVVSGYRLLENDRRLLAKTLRIASVGDHLAQQQALDADVPLRHWLTHPNNCVLLANCVAVSVQFAWGSRQAMRWMRVASLYQQVPLDDVLQQIHQQAVINARQYPANGRLHPAQALLWPWDRAHYLVQRASKKTAAGSAAPSAKPLGGTSKNVSAIEQWRALCGRLLAEPSAFANVLQLTSCARDALLACGMRRVMILVTDRQQTRLQVQQISGLGAEAFQVSLAPSSSQVLQKLLAQPRQLRLHPDNVAQFSALMPGALKALFDGEYLLMRSLASHGQVAMLLIADQGHNALSDVTAQAFSKTAQCIERALHNFASSRR